MYIYRLPVRDTPIIPERQVNFPLNEEVLTLDSGQYAVVIVAFNAQGNQSDQLSAVAEFSVGAGSQGGGLEYPFVYIIVPGIIFVVIIIVINVVIFKKVHETRRRSVTYCKGEFLCGLSSNWPTDMAMLYRIFSYVAAIVSKCLLLLQFSYNITLFLFIVKYLFFFARVARSTRLYECHPASGASLSVLLNVSPCSSGSNQPLRHCHTNLLCEQTATIIP